MGLDEAPEFLNVTAVGSGYGPAAQGVVCQAGPTAYSLEVAGGCAGGDPQSPSLAVHVHLQGEGKWGAGAPRLSLAPAKPLLAK